MRHIHTPTLLPFFAALLFASTASAVGTRTFQLDSAERLSGGESKGVSIGADGYVRPSFALASVPVPEAGSVMSSLALADGSVLLGTAPSGKIYKVSGDKVSEYADTQSLAVTSLIEGPGGTVLAATLPDGKIFKVTAGKATEFSTIKDTSLWALLQTPQGLFAAGGGGEAKGAIFKIEANGSNSVYFKTEEPHLVSLTALGGELFAGSSGQSILYRITGAGKGAVIADFPGQELKAIVPLPAGKASQLLVIANDYPEPPELPRRSPNAGHQAPGPNSSYSQKQKPGKGALFRVSLDGSSEKWMGHSDTHYLSLSYDAEQGKAYVGAGASGRIYAVDDSHAVTQIAETEQRQIVGIALPSGGKGAKSTGFMIASDPVVLHRVEAGRRDRASWTSKVLDAQIPATFGTLSFRGSGAVELQTRSGNTKTPDGSWSDWSRGAKGPGKVQSPGARYLQVRALFSDKDASLGGIVIPFLTANLRAIVTGVEVEDRGFFSKESSGSVPSTGGDIPKGNSKLKISWKVDNPDADALRYRLEFKKEGQLTWRELLRGGEPHTRADYEWDTSVLSEGRYRVRVEASDELANSPETTLRHSQISDSFIIDNTPPVIEKLGFEGGKLKLLAKDGISPIVRVEVAVDGRPEFRPMGASDGLFDSVSEAAEVQLSLVGGSGRHLYFVRVFDAAGNVASREIEGP